MASFASEVTIPQGAEFFSRFGRFGGNMQLLIQLLADDDRMKVWVQSLNDACLVEHIPALVSYRIPSFDELNGTMFDWANDLFSEYEWQEHESVRGYVDRTPGVRSFFLKHFNRDMKCDHIIEWAQSNGYRAATHEEAVDFVKVHPDIRRQYGIIALGSFAVHNGQRNVAILIRYGRLRILDAWFDRVWDTYYWFLLVRM